jgi:hypothetical protein
LDLCASIMVPKSRSESRLDSWPKSIINSWFQQLKPRIPLLPSYLVNKYSNLL